LPGWVKLHQFKVRSHRCENVERRCNKYFEMLHFWQPICFIYQNYVLLAPSVNEPLAIAQCQFGPFQPGVIAINNLK